MPLFMLIDDAQVASARREKFRAALGDENIFFQMHRAFFRAHLGLEREHHAWTIDFGFDLVQRRRLGARHADAVADALRALDHLVAALDELETEVYRPGMVL